ncbi:MAG: hypothetical protein HOE84_07635 [Rhodospirillaceae bacterium]|mgnify:FL=1|jgi:hypothetical protein|nr:hypothetical protein [Rhodospirillaceae bacterium]
MNHELEVSKFTTRQFGYDYRRELAAWLVQLKPEVFVTLNFNRETTVQGGWKTLKEFHARLDRKFLGTDWSTRGFERSDFIFFPENIQTNFHYHGLGVLPVNAERYTTQSLRVIINDIWKALVPSGTTDFQLITASPEILANYVTKQVSHDASRAGYITSREFWPSKNK